MAVSAALFAILHMSGYRFVPTFLLGLVLGTVALAAGSTIPAMVIHALNNAAVIVLHTHGGSKVAIWLENHRSPAAAVAVVVMATGIYLIVGRPRK